MALPPTIPTSFVPHTASTAQHRSRTDLTGAFSFLAYTILGIVFVLAIGVFFYGRILAASQFSKDTALKEAESNIDLEAVDGFIRLRDRLTSGETLLTNHVAFSGFFTLIETILPTTVRFNTLHLSVEDGGIIKVEGTGVAKSFNALAAASTAFANDGHIKDAIFSNIVVRAKDNSVSFTLSAALDQKVVSFSP